LVGAALPVYTADMQALGGRVAGWSLGWGLFVLSGCGGRSIGDELPVDGSPAQAGNGARSGSAGHAGGSSVIGFGGNGGALAMGGYAAGATEGGASVGGAAVGGGATADPNDLTTGWPAPAPDAASEATTYQLNSHHDGAQPGDALSLPLKQRWAHAFGSASISYPLVAAGRVFVTVAGGQSGGLYALNEATGESLWGPIDLGGFFPWSHAAYALGRVFTVNYDGLMQAFDAASGQQIWTTQLPGQYAFSSPPTVYGRRVFVGGAGGGGTMYGVAGNTGRVLWTAPVENGDDSSPVVTDSGVYVSYACVQAYGFDPASGSLLWHHSGDCEGGGGDTMALLGSVLYARDWASSPLTLDAASGKVEGTFSSTTIPAGSSTTLFTTKSGALVATPLAGVATPLWTYSATMVTSAPLVIGDQVAIGSSVGEAGLTGEIDVLDAKSGKVLSSDPLPAPVSAPSELQSSPLTGMAAADNHLFFSAGGTLYAY
jgi:outer membrane protein assembly factor BamB